MQCPDILYIRSLQCSDRLLLLYVCRRYEIHVCVVPINDVHILSLMFLLSVACFFPGKSRTPFYCLSGCCLVRVVTPGSGHWTRHRLKETHFILSKVHVDFLFQILSIIHGSKHKHEQTCILGHILKFIFESRRLSRRRGDP